MELFLHENPFCKLNVYDVFRAQEDAFIKEKVSMQSSDAALANNRINEKNKDIRTVRSRTTVISVTELLIERHTTLCMRSKNLKFV